MTVYKLTTPDQVVHYFYVRGMALLYRDLRGGVLEVVEVEGSRFPRDSAKIAA